MLLGVPQRIHLLSILPPAEGDAYFLRSVRRLRLALSFTDKETSDWNIQRKTSGAVSWDMGAARDAEVDLTGKAGEYAAAQIRLMSDNGHLPEDLLVVYDYFFPEK